MSLPTTMYLIYDMSESLEDYNIDIIKNLTELKDLPYGTTYQELINARKESLGYGYGYPQYKEGNLVYVLPSLVMGLIINPNSTAIKEVTEEDYVNNYLPTFDVIEIDI
jgi:hypothetical protein